MKLRVLASGSKGNCFVEIWKDIKGFEGIYQISNKGRLKSFKSDSAGRILSIKNSKGGYLSVVLCYKGKRKSVKIHRLVAEAFVPNPHNKPEVNHIDGNKQNPCAENLEWVDRRENVLHAIAQNPNIIKGMVRYNRFIKPKTIQQFSLDGRFVAEYPNAAEAAKATGICYRNILQVAAKEEYKPGKTRKQAGGYIWRFKNKSISGGMAVGY